MRPSNIFLAVITLLSVGLLFLFGITVLPTLGGGGGAAVNANADQAVQALTVPVVDFANPQRGATEPAVTVVEYGDHQCAPCAAMEQDLDKVAQDYPGKVRVVWKDFPNKDLHPDALAAAETARCAGLQGKFWEMHDIMLANTGSTGPDNRYLMAKQLGLDVPSLTSCVDAATTEPLVLRDVEEALRLRIDGTPYLFIGNRRVSGAVGYDQLKGFVGAAIAGAASAAGR
jgi:protein-disulfide isomerase